MNSSSSLFKAILILILLTTVNCSLLKKRGPGEGPDKTPPEAGNAIPITHFAKLDTCRPTLTWNAVPIQNAPVVTYDVVVYQAQKVQKKLYSMGRGVFYREGHPTISVTLDNPLPSKTPYFWSIRVRLPDGKVSQWSTKSKSVNNPPGTPEYDDRWHGFITADDCY